MQVRNEHMMNALHFYAVLAQLHLGSFAAINEEVLVMHIYDLTGRMVPHGRQCCAAAQYGDVEFHDKKNRSHVVSGLRFLFNA